MMKELRMKQLFKLNPIKPKENKPMKKLLFNCGQSYSLVTPESAEQGDFAETGWEVEPTRTWTLKEIVSELRRQGIEYINRRAEGFDVYGYFNTEDYSTLEEKQLCFHINGLKPQQVKRFNQVLRRYFNE